MGADRQQEVYTSLAKMAKIWSDAGIKDAVLSPGSRSAPLALTILRSNDFNCYHIVDERSAAYFALGLTKRSQQPTILICTSGSALANYYPAVTEAYFQHLPLLILSADRPAEWIDQNDNQAIFQQGIFGKHVLYFGQMPDSYELEAVKNMGLAQAISAVKTSMGLRNGPVHLNFPFREPFYFEEKIKLDDQNNQWKWGSSPKIATDSLAIENLISTINKSQQVWILGGMTNYPIGLQFVIALAEKVNAHLYFDPLLNVLDNSKGRLRTVKELSQLESPDLVLSFGQQFLSKEIKTLLRGLEIPNHVHLQPFESLNDPFQSIDQLLLGSVDEAVSQLLNGVELKPHKPAGFSKESEDRISEDVELSLAEKLLSSLPHGCDLHVGNSTPVRYALYFDAILKEKKVRLYANRGVSGIDGSISMAIGMSQDEERPQILLLGDLSAYYDRNGLWNNYLPTGFKIIVMNNAGGGIFKRIKGAKDQAELESYFVNEQPTDFQALAGSHGFGFNKVDAASWNESQIDAFFSSKERELLEVVVTD